MDLYLRVASTSTILSNSSNQNLEFSIVNNYDFDENRIIDLSLLNVEVLEFNFTDAEQEVRDNFIQNYIINFAQSIINVNNFWWESIDFGIDYTLTVHINNQTFNFNTLADFENIDFINAIYEFLTATDIVELSVEINSVLTSVKVMNWTHFIIINNPFSDELAPVIPPEPDPSLPNPDIPDGENVDEDGNIIGGENQNRLNLLWLLSLIIPVDGLIWFIVWLVKNKKNKKIK